MVPMKIIVFIICVCSFQSTDAAFGSDFLNALKLNFKTIQNYIRPPPAVEEYLRVVEIEETIIDMNSYTPNTFEYHKNAVLLFCHIIENRFFQSLLPVFQLREKLENLRENDGRGESDLMKELSDLTIELLHFYNGAILVNGYTDMAYYYNALQWLNHYKVESAKVSEIIKEIIQYGRKARNYLFEFIMPQRIAAFIDITDNQFRRIDGWTEEDVYSVALTFIGDIWEVDKDAAHKAEMKYTDLELYELMFEHANPHNFYKTMHIDVWQAHVLINQRLDYESTINTDVQSPFTKGLAADNINLGILPKGHIRYYKHVGILFIEAVEKRIKINVPNDIREELINYPEDDTRHKNLRYCTFQRWFSTLIQTIGSEFPKNDFSKNLLKRLTMLRLFDWFGAQMRESNTNLRLCNDLFEAVSKFQQTFSLTSPLSYEKGVSYDKKYKSVNTLELLLSMGELEIDAINTITQISIATLTKDLEHFEPELKRLQQFQSPTAETLSTITDYKYHISTMKQVKEFLLTRLGNPQKDTMLCESPSFYENIIKSKSELMERLAITFIEKEEWKTYYNTNFPQQSQDNPQGSE